MTATAEGTTRLIYRLAAWFTFLTVLMGSAVCATESGAACPSWPGCYVGQVTPDTVSSGIEFGHRSIAFLALVLMGLAGWRGRRHPDPRVRWFPWAALAASVASAVFGMMVILFSLSKTLGVVDLGAALVALCLTTAAAVWLEPGERPTDDRGVLIGRTAWAAAAAIVVMHLLGIVVATTGSFIRCLGWPVWRVADSDLLPEVQVVRIVLGVLAAGTLAVSIVRALGIPALRRTALLAGGLLAVELALGQVIAGQFSGTEPRQVGVAAIYSMLAVAILVVTALLAARAVRPSADGPPRTGPQRLEEARVRGARPDEAA